MDNLIETCERFLSVWHERDRADFERRSTLVYDTYKAKRLVERRDYICLDQSNGPGSWSGVYMVRKSDGEVFTIKAYGRPNRPIGLINSLIEQWGSP